METKDFNVGDRVRFISPGFPPYTLLSFGDEGFVIAVTSIVVGVEWDNEMGGHDCDRRGKDGHCVYLVNSILEKKSPYEDKVI